MVSTPLGFVLPGGGRGGGESAEEAAVREAMEECGPRVALAGRVGVADELGVWRVQGVHYRKRCTFFRAAVIGRDGPGEPDHQLVWVPPAGSASVLRHGSQRRAIAQAYRRGPKGHR